MSPETPAVKIGRCIEYLGQSCSLGCGEDHGGHVSNEDVHPPKTIVYGALVDVAGQVHDTPRINPPKPPAET